MRTPACHVISEALQQSILSIQHRRAAAEHLDQFQLSAFSSAESSLCTLIEVLQDVNDTDLQHLVAILIRRLY